MVTTSGDASYFWVFIQDQRDDQHPNAYALRLKLFYVASISGYPISWDLGQELSGYYNKLNHVAAVCRLSSQEEQYLLQQIPISERDHRITNRLNFVDAFSHKQKTMPVAYPPRFIIKDEFDNVTDKSALSLASDSFFSKFTAVTYKRPLELVGTQTMNAVNKWLDNGLNLSGGKDELGRLSFPSPSDHLRFLVLL